MTYQYSLSVPSSRVQQSKNCLFPSLHPSIDALNTLLSTSRAWLRLSYSAAVRFAYSYECLSSLPNYYLLLNWCTCLSMTFYERWGIKLHLYVPWGHREFSRRITASIIMDFADTLIHVLKVEEQSAGGVSPHSFGDILCPCFVFLAL